MKKTNKHIVELSEERTKESECDGRREKNLNGKNVDTTICALQQQQQHGSSSSNTYAVHHLDFLALHDIFFIYSLLCQMHWEKIRQKKPTTKKRLYLGMHQRD